MLLCLVLFLINSVLLLFFHREEYRINYASHREPRKEGRKDTVRYYLVLGKEGRKKNDGDDGCTHSKIYYVHFSNHCMRA